MEHFWRICDNYSRGHAAEKELAVQMNRALALLQAHPDKEACPPMVCKLNNRRKSVIMCEQWFCLGCVGLAAKTADALDTFNTY